jgi:VCBS repeat protein
VAAGDVNEDGCPDVVLFDNLGIARVFLGNCDSTFRAQSNQIGEGDLTWAATLADVNGDGHLDLAYAGVWYPRFHNSLCSLTLSSQSCLRMQT